MKTKACEMIHNSSTTMSTNYKHQEQGDKVLVPMQQCATLIWWWSPATSIKIRMIVMTKGIEV